MPVTVEIEILCVDVQFGQENYTVVLLYRSPSVPQREFLANIESLLAWLQDNKTTKIILLGDFNVDLLKFSNSPLSRLTEGFSFKQVVTEATHRFGSCLDHIYLPERCSGIVTVIPTYYSDHYFVHAQIINY